MTKPSELDSPQRRHLTILFSDISDSTRISAMMEPEFYYELLQQLRALIDRIVPRHGGTIVRIDGDGVLAVFGYPDACDDAGRRATEAALDLHNAVSVLDQALGPCETVFRLHSGIHAGVVLVRPGDLVLGRIELLGDATNATARLCDAAGADEILVSNAALGADRLFYTSTPRQISGIAGLARPLQAFQILGRAPVETRFSARIRRGLTTFEGRRAELDRLVRLLDASVRGPRLVAVVGPQGIGKTRLLGEFVDLAEQRGVGAHRGYCESYLGARPLQPFAQIAQSILSSATDPASQSDPTLQSMLLAKADQPPPGPEQVADALVTLLSRTATGKMRILSIDDWQWADDASRQCLGLIAARLDEPLLLLLSSRGSNDFSDPGPQPDVIALQPLSSTESAAAVEGLLATSEPFLVDRICGLAGGNPLFIEELCHGFQNGDASESPTDFGGWIDMLVQARLARLSQEQANLVRTASVIGHVFADKLLETLTGIGADSPILTELIHEDFLYQGEVPGTLRFKHGLAREAVYACVGRDERIRLHARIAEILSAQSAATDSDAHLEALAYHFEASADWERAFRYGVAAGDAAMAVSALDRGQDFYRAAYRALTALPRTHVLWDDYNGLVGRYGRACVIDPARAQLPVLESMAARAHERGDAAGAALAEYWLGTVHYGLGDARASISRLERAQRFAEGTTTGLAAYIVAALGQSHGIACHYAEAIRLLELAVALKKPHWNGAHPSPGLAYVAATRGLLHADQGEFTEADRWFDQGIGYLAGIDHQIMASILGHRIAARLWQGDYTGAAAVAARCSDVAARVKARYLFAISHALAAYAQWRIDGSSDAVAAMVKHTEWLNAGASRQRISLLYGWLAEIMVSLERHDEALRYACLALSRARHGDRLGEATAFRALARIAARADGTCKRSVAHYLDRAFRSAAVRSSRHEHARTALCVAELALARGANDEAARFAERAEADLAAMDMPQDLALARTIRAAATR